MDARKELIQSSLIMRNIDLGFVKIHRLVQDVVRQQFSIDDLRAVLDAAVVLVSAIWPFFDESNELGAARLRQVQQYLPHAARFRDLVSEKNPDVLKPGIGIAGLFNEAAWYYILQSWGLNLQLSFEFARTSEEVLLASNNDEDSNMHSRLLSNSYRYQGISSTYMLTESAVPCCEKWIKLLAGRIEKYGEDVDIKTIPISYNELGIALLTQAKTDEAVRSFTTCCELLDQQRAPGKLPFPFAWQHKASVTAYSGDPEAAYDILAAVIKEREDVLGRDNTDGIE